MNITDEDREAAYRATREMNMTLLAKGEVLAEHFAAHRIAAYRQGIEDAARVAQDNLAFGSQNLIVADIRRLATPPVRPE